MVDIVQVQSSTSCLVDTSCTLNQLQWPHWGFCADHDPRGPGLSGRHRPTCTAEHQQQRPPDVKPRPERFPRNGDTSALRGSVILLELQWLGQKSANHQLMARKSILIPNKPSMIKQNRSVKKCQGQYGHSRRPCLPRDGPRWTASGHEQLGFAVRGWWLILVSIGLY